MAVSRSAVVGLAVGMGVSTGGSVLDLLAFVDVVNDRTHAAVPLGAAVLVNFVPAGLLMPLLGRFLAGRDLRRLAIVLGGVESAVPLLMALAVVLGWPLVVLYAASAVLWLLVQASRICISTLLPAYVAPSQLRRVNLTLQIAGQAGASVAALGVFLAGGAPNGVLFVADAVTFVAQAVAIAAAVPATVSADAAGHVPQSMPSRAVLRRRLSMVLLLPTGYVTINALNAAIPLVALQLLHGGEGAYAAASAVYPASAVVVGAAVRRGGGAPLPVALAVVAAGWLGFAFARSTAMLLVAVALTAVGVITANAAGMAWAQEQAPGELAAIQSWATSYGSLAAAAVVVALTFAFGHGSSTWGFAALAAAFFVAAASARATTRPVVQAA